MARAGCSNFRYPVTMQEIKYEFDNRKRERERVRDRCCIFLLAGEFPFRQVSLDL